MRRSAEHLSRTGKRILLQQAKVPNVAIHHSTDTPELLRKPPGDISEECATVMWIGLDDLHTANRELLKHSQANAVVYIGFPQDLLPSARERMPEKYRIICLVQGSNATV